MKGLIIKDLMCLRKQRIIFSLAVIETFIVSVMFVQSYKYGNIHKAAAVIVSLDPEGSWLVNLGSLLILILFMLIPIALTDVTVVFEYDDKAGFAPVSASLPVSTEKRVLSRYFSAFSMLGIGVGADILISFILSRITDIIDFKDFLSIILSSASIMIMFDSLAVLFCFRLGKGKEAASRLVSLLAMFCGFFLVFFKKIREILVCISNETVADLSYITGALDFIKEKYYLLLAAAFVVTVASYLCALKTATEKRGII